MEWRLHPLWLVNLGQHIFMFDFLRLLRRTDSLPAHISSLFLFWDDQTLHGFLRGNQEGVFRH